MVGAGVLMVCYPGNKGSYNVAGKSFLYLVIILVHSFMKSLTVVLQRLALHDLNTQFLKSEWFIKRWLSSKKETRLQAIRKPTRHQWGVGFHDHCGIDIKED